MSHERQREDKVALRSNDGEGLHQKKHLQPNRLQMLQKSERLLCPIRAVEVRILAVLRASHHPAVAVHQCGD